jgi:hypothetical protein
VGDEQVRFPRLRWRAGLCGSVNGKDVEQEAHLWNDDLMVVQCTLHERTEAIVVLERLEWGEFSDPTPRVSIRFPWSS